MLTLFQSKNQSDLNMKTLLNRILFVSLVILLITGFSTEAVSKKKPKNTFAKGADISWLPQMESTGYQFYNDKGKKEDCFKILKDMASRFGKEVMVVEVGGEDNKVQNTYDMLIAVQKKVKEVPEKKGTGVFYWEPEGAGNWSHYGLPTRQ